MSEQFSLHPCKDSIQCNLNDHVVWIQFFAPGFLCLSIHFTCNENLWFNEKNENEPFFLLDPQSVLIIISFLFMSCLTVSFISTFSFIYYLLSSLWRKNQIIILFRLSSFWLLLSYIRTFDSKLNFLLIFTLFFSLCLVCSNIFSLNCITWSFEWIDSWLRVSFEAFSDDFIISWSGEEDASSIKTP